MNPLEKNGGILINPLLRKPEDAFDFNPDKPEKYTHTTEDGRYFECPYPEYEDAANNGRTMMVLFEPPKLAFFTKEEYEQLVNINKGIKAAVHKRNTQYKAVPKNRKKNKQAKKSRKKNRK